MQLLIQIRNSDEVKVDGDWKIDAGKVLYNMYYMFKFWSEIYDLKICIFFFHFLFK